MRVLLLSDTHGVLDERIAGLAHASDLVVHAGDIGSAGVLAALQTACRRVVAIRGNNDVPAKWPLSDHVVLHALAQHAEIDLPGGRLAIVHGDRWPATTRHARLRRLSPDAHAIVYGHSHRLCVDLSEQPWLLNPGAAGRARTFGGPNCLVLHATHRRWQVDAIRFSGAAV